MGAIQRYCEILENERLTEHGYSLRVRFPEAAAEAGAGQFAFIRCGEGQFLRRPISICEIDSERGTLRFVYEIRGDGTGWLAERAAGEIIDILAPLGNRFLWEPFSGKILLVGGGIGAPPLLEVAKQQSGSAEVFLGFRDKNAVLLEEDFRRLGALSIATEDGSFGEKGFVTGPLGRRLAEGGVDLICACGPKPMLRAVANLAQKSGVRCLVSLEERMGCGIGACRVCACAVGGEYRRVCRDGPIFDAEEVDWND